LAVLLTGLGFGLSDVAPIPAIVLAQALNGVLLPIVAIFLLLEVNDRSSMGKQGVNGVFSNTVMTLVVAVTVLLGTANVARAVARTVGWSAPTHGTLLVVSAVVMIVVAVPVHRALKQRRSL
jgi:Mn2+/Fe2+ NRAMP family transporter